MNERKDTQGIGKQARSTAAVLSSAKNVGGIDRTVEHDVLDKANNKIGTLSCVWVDSSGRPAFLGIKTGWIFGKTHVVPAEVAEVNSVARRIRLPFDQEMIKTAPTYDADQELGFEAERKVRDYYHLGLAGAPREEERVHEETKPRFSTTDLPAKETAPRFTEKGTTPAASVPKMEPESVRMQLSEEQLQIGKRQVDAGGVHLRKVVRVETIHQPVDLAHEEIEIERVPARDAQLRGAAFTEQDIYIPLHREEAVIQKESHVREEIRARRRTDVEHRDIAESVRREDVQVEREGEVKRAQTEKK